MNKITWDMFNAFNSDTKVAFEGLCRNLFKRQFVADEVILSSVPNNPGVEVEPVSHKDTGIMISFQAKHFGGKIEYGDILDSMKKAVEYYSGNLDCIYLYCNKDITKTNKKYKIACSLLEEANIKLELITGNSLIDEIQKYDGLMIQYFSQNLLSHDWFEQTLKYHLTILGQRYNGKFNIETESERMFALFVQDELAVAHINATKNKLIDKIYNERHKYDKCISYLSNFYKYLKSINDVTIDTITDCLMWRENFCTHFASEISALKLYEEELYSVLRKNNNNKNGSKVQEELNELNMLLSLLEEIGPNEQDRMMLNSQVLVIFGKAGTGKSQLFSATAKRIIDNNHYSVLLLGQCFMSQEDILHQIVINLGLEYSFDKFLDVLNVLGERANQKVCILIDALNESTYKSAWSYGLPKIIEILKKCPYVRLAVSVRSGYEKQVIHESLNEKIKSKEIATIYHNGFFDESPSSIQDFLNHYGVPFSPEYYLHSQWSNPLFLTLFCKVYDNQDYSIFNLMNRIIENIDSDSKKAMGLDFDAPLLPLFLDEFSEQILKSNDVSIRIDDVNDFTFWTKYNISNLKYLESLEKCGLLQILVYNEEKHYYFSYDLLKDYICAKWVIRKYRDKDNIKKYIHDDLLNISNNKITNYNSYDIFAIVCTLYADKFNEECIDIISNVDDCEEYYIEYINSYIWRNRESINCEMFCNLARSYLSFDEFIRILIECALRNNHPLNVYFLHKYLMGLTLPIRDYYWTIFTNSIYANQERLSFLIDYINECNVFDSINNESNRKLITLFVWLLTSSNRNVRDKASKAVVELLKNDFEYCKSLLASFEKVNDPYVIQRLYGIVFGACVKKNNCEPVIFKELTEYVYQTIFLKDMVYSDVLLRDYAMLIIERYIYEFPSEKNRFDENVFKPPYKSANIPKLEYHIKDNLDFNSGLRRIERSMMPEHIYGSPFIYGDFGRYVFQNTVCRFKNIEIKYLFNYAMHYIKDTLGYNDEWFSDYDCSSFLGRYERHEQRKCERIGKKYQWITFYHILAILSDHNELDYNTGYELFKGAWQIGVRDFDPTINENNINNPDIPNLQPREDFNNDFIIDEKTENEIEAWSKESPMLFDNIKNDMVLVDGQSGVEWVILYRYDDYTYDNDKLEYSFFSLSKSTQKIWMITQAYIVDKINVDIIADKLLSGDTSELPRHNDGMTGLFNREYSWSDAVNEIYAERDYILIEKSNGKIDWKDHVWSDEPLKLLGRLVPAYEYSRCVFDDDASISDRHRFLSFYLPSKEINNYLCLDQKEHDGYYYSDDGTLVAYDSQIMNGNNGLIIRKDYLEKYLNNYHKSIIWYCYGEKQYLLDNHNQIWSEWKGIYYFHKGQVLGEMHCKQPESSIQNQENCNDDIHQTDEVFDEYLKLIGVYSKDDNE